MKGVRVAEFASLLAALGGCAVATNNGSVAPSPALAYKSPEPSADAQRSEPTPAAANAAQPITLQEPRCPEEMALVRRLQGPYCVDRWESSIVTLDKGGKSSFWPGNHPVDGIEGRVRAVSVAGRKPQGYISGAQAATACSHSGKRLCEVDEWVRACRGAKMTRYPYGDQRRPNVCNDRFQKLDHHPVVTLFSREYGPGADQTRMWYPSFMNDPRLYEMEHSVAPTGSFKGCTNELGVYDMVGNLHEWVADPDGTFMGGFFMDTFQNGEGCEYRTIAHEFEYHDYSTGFRCCADALGAAHAVPVRKKTTTEPAPPPAIGKVSARARPAAQLMPN